MHRIAQSILQIVQSAKKYDVYSIHIVDSLEKNSLCLWFISFDLFGTPVKLNEINTVGCDMNEATTTTTATTHSDIKNYLFNELMRIIRE